MSCCVFWEQKINLGFKLKKTSIQTKTQIFLSQIWMIFNIFTYVTSSSHTSWLDTLGFACVYWALTHDHLCCVSIPSGVTSLHSCVHHESTGSAPRVNHASSKSPETSRGAPGEHLACCRPRPSLITALISSLHQPGRAASHHRSNSWGWSQLPTDPQRGWNALMLRLCLRGGQHRLGIIQTNTAAVNSVYSLLS